jgi:hypothetical protein
MARPITIEETAISEGAAITLTLDNGRTWRGTVHRINKFSVDLRGVRGGKALLGENVYGRGLFLIRDARRGPWVEALEVAA